MEAKWLCNLLQWGSLCDPGVFLFSVWLFQLCKGCSKLEESPLQILQWGKSIKQSRGKQYGRVFFNLAFRREMATFICKADPSWDCRLWTFMEGRHSFKSLHSLLCMCLTSPIEQLWKKVITLLTRCTHCASVRFLFSTLFPPKTRKKNLSQYKY